MLSILLALSLSQQGVRLIDEGINVGQVTSINFTGTGVACTKAGLAGTCAVTSGGGSGTVTSVSVTPAHGFSCSITNPTTTPAFSCTLGNLDPTSVAASGTVTGSNLSGTNTGDVTIGAANGLSVAGQALSLATAVAGGSNGALLGSDKTKLDATSGTNTGDQTITLTGGITGSGTGTIATTINPATEALAPAPVVGPPLPVAKFLVPYVTASFLPPCNAVRRTRCKETPGGIHQ